MEKKLPREEAWELLTEYTKTSALRKHALAVEAIMCHFARLNGEDEEVWGGALVCFMIWTTKNSRRSIVEKRRRSCGHERLMKPIFVP